MISRHLSRCLLPCHDNLRLKWDDSEIAKNCIHSPHRLNPFCGDNLLVYVLFPKKSPAHIIRLVSDTSNVSDQLELDLSQATEGRTIHCLAARYRIRELEDKILTDPNQNNQNNQEIKQEIIKLATEFSLASVFTSFVIVDETKKFNLRSSFEFVTKQVTN